MDNNGSRTAPGIKGGSRTTSDIKRGSGTAKGRGVGEKPSKSSSPDVKREAPKGTVVSSKGEGLAGSSQATGPSEARKSERKRSSRGGKPKEVGGGDLSLPLFERVPGRKPNCDVPTWLHPSVGELGFDRCLKAVMARKTYRWCLEVKGKALADNLSPTAYVDAVLEEFAFNGGVRGSEEFLLATWLLSEWIPSWKYGWHPEEPGEEGDYTDEDRAELKAHLDVLKRYGFDKDFELVLNKVRESYNSPSEASGAVKPAKAGKPKRSVKVKGALGNDPPDGGSGQ